MGALARDPHTPTTASPRRTEAAQGLSGVVYRELRALGTALAHMPEVQPFAIVSTDGRVLAGNRPLLELLGCGSVRLLGSSWGEIMPAWQAIARSQKRSRASVLVVPLGSCSSASRVSADVAVRPLRGMGEAVVAYTVLLTPADGRVCAQRP